MNNKKIGTDFENEFCDLLAKRGYWVHFITADKRGAQPFDILAVKNQKPIAIDCKTSAKKNFGIERLEDNQIMAFERWMKCGNGSPIVVVKYDNKIYFVPYLLLKEKRKVNLESDEIYCWKQY